MIGLQTGRCHSSNTLPNIVKNRYDNSVNLNIAEDKPKKNNYHIPEWEQAFSTENGRLNLVLRWTKPPTCMIVVYGYATVTNIQGTITNKMSSPGNIQ